VAETDIEWCYTVLPDADGRQRQRQALIDGARGAIRHDLHEVSDPTPEQVEADSWTDLIPYGADGEDDDDAPTMGQQVRRG